MTNRFFIRIFKIAIVFLFVLLGMSACTTKASNQRLEWKYIENTGEFLRIDVDGVKYTQKYDNLWRPLNTSEREEVGENIFYYSCDVNHIFLLLWENKLEKVGATLFVREDATLPPFDREAVDSICFCFPSNYTDDFDGYHLDCRNPDIIDKTFQILGQKVEAKNSKYNEISKQGKMKFAGEIIFYNDSLAGIAVTQDIFAMDDEYWMFLDGVKNYTVISRELFSELTGINMPDASEFSQLTTEEIYDFYGVDIK